MYEVQSLYVKNKVYKVQRRNHFSTSCQIFTRWQIHEI